jgi:hypothetical protein
MEKDEHVARAFKKNFLQAVFFIWYTVKSQVTLNGLKSPPPPSCSLRSWEDGMVMSLKSHSGDRVDAQDVEAFSHDGGSGVTQEHSPHVHFQHLTC